MRTRSRHAERTSRTRRGRRLGVGAAATVSVVLAGTALHASAAIPLLTVAPATGPRGTSYEVSVRCAEDPDLTARELTGEKPPSTTPPLQYFEPGSVTSPEPGRRVYRTKAGPYDRDYWAHCGETFQRARFDVDLPRLYLGPVPGPIDFDPPPRTKLLGTDCPAGSTAQVRIAVGGRTVSGPARMDANHDWAFDLPFPDGAKDMTVRATCGSVVYPPLAILARPAFTRPVDQASIIRLYRASFLRAPEGSSLLFWARAHEAGQTLGTIATRFGAAGEFQRRYGSLTNEQFVDRIFRNVFDRAPDAAGRAHWVRALERGRSRGLVVLGLSESAEFRRITGTV